MQYVKGNVSQPEQAKQLSLASLDLVLERHTWISTPADTGAPYGNEVREQR